MIVCHCTGLSSGDILRAVAWMRASDPEVLITPGKVYRALGRRADCGGCLPLFIETMRASGQLEIGAPGGCGAHAPRIRKGPHR